MAEPVTGDVFRRAARYARHRPAVTLDDTTWTYGELDGYGNRLARGLLEIGVHRGDRLVLWSELSINFAALFVAVAKIGVSLAPLAPVFGLDEAAEAIRRIKPTLVVCDPPRLGLVQEITAEQRMRTAILPDLVLSSARMSAEDIRGFQVDPADAHILYLTSGTTGSPKVVITSHRVNLLRGHPGALPDGRGTAVCTFPLFHMAGWTIAMFQWFAHAHVVLLRSTAAADVYEALTRYRAERIQCVPVVWQRLLDYVDAIADAKDVLTHLKFVDAGVSAVPHGLLERIQRTFPQACTRVTYGSSEAGLITLLTGPDIRLKAETCGLPGPFTDLRIDKGEILVRSPVLFDGYLDDPEATSAALDADGWYRTGDSGFLDEDGYLTLTGRVRDVLRSGGEYVPPAEVEAVLAEHPDVLEVAVVGLPDPLWGDLVCAAVVLKDGVAAPTLESLVALCEGRLAPFKRPRRIVVLPELPRTAATDRIIRSAVRERVIAAQAQSP